MQFVIKLMLKFLRIFCILTILLSLIFFILTKKNKLKIQFFLKKFYNNIIKFKAS